MRAASTPNQRPPDARLLVADANDAGGRLRHAARSDLPRLLNPGDLLVANDAATLPASLHGTHVRTGAAIEVRLAGWRAPTFESVQEFDAVVFGAGDYRTRTEERPLPPSLRVGDVLSLGPLRAEVLRLLCHPRLVALHLAGTQDEIRAGLARHGVPIQYAHVAQPLALWDVWTRVAAQPVAFEAPSAGFVLDWQMLDAFAARDIGFATLTHAAGISSTGDVALDARLPFDEPYLLPTATVRAIERTRLIGGRVVALGTTVVRALEHAATRGPRLFAGSGVATQRIGPATRLHVVDAIVTGTHEPGSSHYELLRAFAGRPLLERVSAALEQGNYRTHEFGDSLLIVRKSRAAVQPCIARRSTACHLQSALNSA